MIRIFIGQRWSKVRISNKALWVLAVTVVTVALLTSCTVEGNESIEGITGEEIPIKTAGIEVILKENEGKLVTNYKGYNGTYAIILQKDGEENYNTYLISENSSEIVNITYGSGEYELKVCKLTEDSKLRVLENHGIQIELVDEYAPFKGISYYTNYGTGIEDLIKLIGYENTNEFTEKTYRYIVENIEYDHDLAWMVTSGHLLIYRPSIDNIIERGKGICIDQASLMASILRYKDIPTKIAIGYNDIHEYHAWVEVLVDGEWLMYDPTNNYKHGDIVVENYRVLRYY